MTTVRIDLRRPDADGVDVPATGYVQWKPTSRRHVEEGDEDYVVLPDSFMAPAQGEVEVAPTGPDWCWKVTERTLNLAGVTRHVAVPNTVGVVDYGDLVDVDPKTLDPAVEPEAAWNLALANLTAVVEDLQVAQVPPEEIAAAVAAWLDENPVEGVTQQQLDDAIAAVELTPGPKGDKGDTGDPGAPGAAGPANTLSIGTVTTGAAGSSASASVAGTAPNQTLNLTIPRGATGSTGAPGAPGTPGEDGQDGAPGADGADGASAYEVAVANGFVGTEAAWLASLVGPAGADGQDGAEGPEGPEGPQGEPGADGTGGAAPNGTVCVGDSQMSDSVVYGGTKKFHELVAEYTGATSLSIGYGGADSVAIAGMVGATLARITAPVTIPTTGAVTIPVANIDLPRAIQYEFAANQGVLGVHGAWNGSQAPTGDKTFTRTEAGTAVTVPAGTYFQPDRAQGLNGLVALCFMGHNDPGHGLTQANILPSLKAIAEKFQGRIVVFTPIPKPTDSPTLYAATEDAIVAEFGQRAIVTRKWLGQYGLTWAGITPTSDDIADVTAEAVPRSFFWTDSKHLNESARRVLARLAAEISIATGWVTPGVVVEPPPADTEDPTAPTIGTPTKTHNSVSLPFSGATDNTGVTGYSLRQDGVIVSGTFTTSPRVVTGLNPSTEYDFEIRARDAAGNVSPWSNLVTVTTDAAPIDTEDPTQPGVVVVSGLTTTGATITWPDSSDNVGVDHYLVTGVGADRTPTSPTFTFTGLTAATEYSGTVYAVDAAGNESTGRAFSFTTEAVAAGYDLNTEAGTIADWRADGLTTGVISSWAPTRGIETAALTANGTPEVIDALTPAGGKAVKFVRASQEYMTADWADYATPLTVVAVARHAALNSYIWAGHPSGPPFTNHYYGNDGNFYANVGAGAIYTTGNQTWNVHVIVFNGTQSRQYVNSGTPTTQTTTTGAAHTGITVAANGSKSTPGEIELARLVFVNRALTDAECKDVVTALKTAHGIA